MKYSRLLFVGGGMLASVFAAFSAKKSDKPNIVFILCDDMGYGDLGCYGQKYIETPNIDRMASEGMRFTQAYSGSPVSAPSRACIMTGQHTGHGEVRGNKEYWRDSGEVRYGVNTDYAIVGQHPYDPNRVILPEIMKEYIESQANDHILFTWHGGETLMRPLDFYQKVVRLQAQYGRGRIIDNSIQTNGTLLTDS